MSSFPWKKILDYLAETGRERDANLFCYKALMGLEKLVDADGSVLQMVGPGRSLLPSSKTHNFPDKALQQYRTHYYRLDPGRTSYPEGITVAAAKWSDFKESEIIVDFLKANCVRASGGVFLYDFRGNMFAFLNVHKSTEGGFSERAISVMRIVQPHLNNLLVNLTTPSPIELEIVTPEEMLGGRKMMTRREAEIVGFLYRRFSAHQIGDMLGISPRTVERHVEHIYEKLGIGKKQDLFRLLARGKGDRGELFG